MFPFGFLFNSKEKRPDAKQPRRPQEAPRKTNNGQEIQMGLDEKTYENPVNYEVLNEITKVCKKRIGAILNTLENNPSSLDRVVVSPSLKAFDFLTNHKRLGVSPEFSLTFRLNLLIKKATSELTRSEKSSIPFDPVSAFAPLFKYEKDLGALQVILDRNATETKNESDELYRHIIERYTQEGSQISTLVREFRMLVGSLPDKVRDFNIHLNISEIEKREEAFNKWKEQKNNTNISHLLTGAKIVGSFFQLAKGIKKITSMLSPSLEKDLQEKQKRFFEQQDLKTYTENIKKLFELEYSSIINKSGEFLNFLEVSDRLGSLDSRTKLLLNLRDQTVNVLNASQILPGYNHIPTDTKSDYLKFIIRHDPDLRFFPQNQHNLISLPDLLSYALIMRNAARYRFEFGKKYSQNNISAFGDLSYWEKKINEIIERYPQVFTANAQKNLRLLCLNDFNVESSSVSAGAVISESSMNIKNEVPPQITPAPKIRLIDRLIKDIELDPVPMYNDKRYKQILVENLPVPEHEYGALDRFFHKKGIDPKSVSYHIKIAVEKTHGDRLVEDQYLTFHSETELRDYLNQANTKSIRDFDITWRENGNQRQAYSFLNNREEYAKNGYTAEFGRGLIDLWKLVYKENYAQELRKKVFTLSKISDLLTQSVPLDQIFNEPPKPSPLSKLLEGIRKDAASENKPSH